MSYCRNCGGAVADTDKFCSKCGMGVTMSSSNNLEPVGNTVKTQPSEATPQIKGWREINQSRAAVLTVVGIISFSYLLAIIGLASGGNNNSAMIIGALTLDIILVIFLLKGKRWARNWMIWRAILGLVVWSAIYAFNNEYTSILGQIGYCVPVILLLTGTSTRLRIWGSIALFLVAFFGAIFIDVAKALATIEL